MCVSLERQKGKHITANLSNLKEDMPDNPIIAEALNMFDEEVSNDIKSGK